MTLVSEWCVFGLLSVLLYALVGCYVIDIGRDIRNQKFTMAMTTCTEICSTEAMVKEVRCETMKLVCWNICDGRGGNLEAALRGLSEMKIDLCVLTETKMVESYTRRFEDYKVMASISDGKKGSVAVVFKETSWWHAEGVKFVGANIVSMNVHVGDRRWSLIGVYLPPSEEVGPTIGQLIQEMDTAEYPLIVMGDFNTNFKALRNEREDHIVIDFEGVGLNLCNVMNHF